MKQKVVSVLLALVMVLSLLPTAWAETENAAAEGSLGIVNKTLAEGEKDIVLEESDLAVTDAGKVATISGSVDTGKNTINNINDESVPGIKVNVPTTATTLVFSGMEFKGAIRGIDTNRVTESAQPNGDILEKVRFENCTFSGVLYASFADLAKNVEFIGCKFTNTEITTESGGGVYSLFINYATKWLKASEQTLTFDGCAFSGTRAVQVTNPDGVSITFTKNTFELPEDSTYAICLNSAGSDGKNLFGNIEISYNNLVQGAQLVTLKKNKLEFKEGASASICGNTISGASVLMGGDDGATEFSKDGITVKFTVAFNSVDGGEVAAQTVVDGEMATKPADPTRSGYTFGGWYTDSACTAEYDFNTPVTAGITLYAKWMIDKYTVTVNTVNGTAAATKTVDHGDTLTLDTPTRSGYTFDGWYRDGAKWTNGGAVTENMTLIAHWTKNVEEGTNVATKVDVKEDGTVVETVTETKTTGTATTEVKTSTTVKADGTMTETETKTATDSTTNVTATTTVTNTEAKVTAAVATEDAAVKADNKTVTVDATTDELSNDTGKVKKVTVTIDSSSANKLQAAASAGAVTAVEVKTDVGTLTIDNTALKTLTKAGGKLELVVEKTAETTSTTNTTTKTTATFELTAYVDGVPVFGVTNKGNNGTITVTVSWPEPASNERVRAYYVADDGTRTLMGGAGYQNGSFSWDTNHFSTFVVVTEQVSSSGHTTITTNTGKATSATTFDAGVGIYAVSAILSVTGMAWVGKNGRKKS